MNTTLPSESIQSPTHDKNLTPSPSTNSQKWLALLVGEVTRLHICQVAESNYTTWRSLPTEYVAVVDGKCTGSTAACSSPKARPLKVAVVSWWWDTVPNPYAAPATWADDVDDATYPTRNVLASLIYARHAAITHLLIDVFSIDQSLAPVRDTTCHSRL